MKKILAVAILGLSLCVANSAAYAQEDNKIMVDGVELVDTEVYYETGVLMVPIRAVGEALGFEVSWNQQGKWVNVNKGELKTTILLEREGYSKNKGNYSTLGQAPLVMGNQTYVPITFVTDYMEVPFEIGEEGILMIGNTTLGQSLYIKGYIQSVRDDGSLLVCGNGIYGEVVLHLDDKTVVLDAAGQRIKGTSLAEGDKLEADYGPVVTKSIPLQATAQEIRLLKEESSLRGIIERNDEQGILVKGASSNFGQQVRLLINEDTIMIDQKGETITKEALVSGMLIKASHSSLATFSLPPQTVAYLIEVVVE